MNVHKDVAAVAVPEDPARMQETGSEYTTLSDGDQTESEYSIEDDSEDEKGKDKKHTSTYSIKFGRAFPRLVLLTTCLCFIATLLLTVNIQLFITTEYTTGLYNATTDMLHAQITEVSVKSLLNTQLDTMVSLPLSRSSMESHEQCLARSLYVANASLSAGLGFQYPDIRDRVIEWAGEHCGRQLFSPQVVVKAPTAKQQLERHWADFAYRCRYVAERLVHSLRNFKHEMNRAYFRCVIRNWVRYGVEIEKFEERIVPKTSTPAKVLPDVPFGFKFVCEDGRPCHLTYPNGTDQSTSEANSTSSTTITTHNTTTLFNHLNTRKNNLSKIITYLKATRSTTITLINLICCAQMALLVLMMFLSAFVHRTFLETFASNQTKVGILIVMLARQYLMFFTSQMTQHSMKTLLLFNGAVLAEHALLVVMGRYMNVIIERYKATQLAVEPAFIDGYDTDTDTETKTEEYISEQNKHEAPNMNHTRYETATDVYTDSESEDGEYMVGSDTVDLGGGLTTQDISEVDMEDGWAVL
ncbi:hypothetical protein P3342_006899 [Pyrenophora teres f. teres]|nr:hypothetical protein P3342_006899 [Pyrenophora teres f. teres]